jgi:uncharacterized protein YodC (DUF2158 family)
MRRVSSGPLLALLLIGWSPSELNCHWFQKRKEQPATFENIMLVTSAIPSPTYSQQIFRICLFVFRMRTGAVGIHVQAIVSSGSGFRDSELTTSAL